MSSIKEALQKAAQTANPTAKAPEVSVPSTANLTANSSSGV